MSSIHKLPQNVINQIAAGEVIERPASIVKELVENAIDAGASHVEIKIKEGGITFIQISDNGHGIEPGDLPIAVQRFTTSKLSDISDLEKLTSFGFRGEALASISSISKLTIKTRTKNHKEAYKLVVMYGKYKSPEPTFRPIGTTITVENIFDNIPARKKFLKSPNTEYRYILDTVYNFAIIYPNIRFTLYKNDKQILDLPLNTENNAYLTRIADIYNIEIDHLVQVEHNAYNLHISGVVLKPEFLSTKSKFLKTFVNKRYIIDKNLYSAIKRGIQNYVPKDYKPSAIININIDTKLIDVNVHPRKLEVRFINPFRTYSAVTQSIAKTYNNYSDKLFKKDTQSIDYVHDINQEKSHTNHMLQDWDYKMENATKRLRKSSLNSSPDKSFTPFSIKSYESTTIQHSLQNDKTSVLVQMNYTIDNQNIRNIYQLLNRYILVEWESEIWIIDQHAAAERIRFEKLIDIYENKHQIETQKVFLGNKIFLSAIEKSIIEEKKHILKNLGFAFTIKDDYIEITGIPTFLKSKDIPLLIKDIITEMKELDDVYLQDIKFASENRFAHLLATIACHNSIRANEKLNNIELKAIIDNLLECRVPYACPHGRKLIWKLSKEDIDRQFMRQV